MTDHAKTIAAILAQINSIILGKEKQVHDCVACLLSGGHLLIEDVPGVGKTTLAHAISATFGLQYSRVQFTSDLMPGDILGVSIYDKGKEGFVFHKGPVFAQVLLADEINRASPKAQSALLEAMEERQVTVEGQTHRLPTPFFVIATQNPGSQLGTHELPESQLDRFMMRVTLGYPHKESEIDMLAAGGSRRKVASLQHVIDQAQLHVLQAACDQVTVRRELLEYLYRVIEATRSPRFFVTGLSPRAGLSVLQAAKTNAFMQGRNFVSPDDVQEVAVQTISHRLKARSDQGRDMTAQMVLAMLKDIPL